MSLYSYGDIWVYDINQKSRTNMNDIENGLQWMFALAQLLEAS